MTYGYLYVIVKLLTKRACQILAQINVYNVR